MSTSPSSSNLASRNQARAKRGTPIAKGSANPAYIAAMRELRRSSAAGPQVPKPQKGTRRARNASAIKDSAGY